MRQELRRIDWARDTTVTVVRKIHSGDGSPGVLDAMNDDPACYLFGAHPETNLRGLPGQIIAQHHGSICRATSDGAVWISHLRRKPSSSAELTAKLPANLVPSQEDRLQNRRRRTRASAFLERTPPALCPCLSGVPGGLEVDGGIRQHNRHTADSPPSVQGCP